MIDIVWKDGTHETWESGDYTEYTYNEQTFVVIKDAKWIGIYNIDCVAKIVVSDQ